jgi:hypothetical protein
MESFNDYEYVEISFDRDTIKRNFIGIEYSDKVLYNFSYSSLKNSSFFVKREIYNVIDYYQNINSFKNRDKNYRDIINFNQVLVKLTDGDYILYFPLIIIENDKQSTGVGCTKIEDRNPWFSLNNYRNIQLKKEKYIFIIEDKDIKVKEHSNSGGVFSGIKIEYPICGYVKENIWNTIEKFQNCNCNLSEIHTEEELFLKYGIETSIFEFNYIEDISLVGEVCYKRNCIEVGTKKFKKLDKYSKEICI